MTKREKSKAPTMADVAKLAGVSTMTVSRALKSNTYIKDNTRQSIMEAIQHLGYVMDSTAAGLSSRKTGFVAMVIPSINNANFAQTVKGATEILAKHDLQLLLAYTDYNIETEEKLVAQLLSRRPEAIVLTGSNHTEHCRNLLKNANIPIVETWELPEEPIGYSVGFSNADASRQIVQHFIDAGCKSLAFIGGDSPADTRGFERRNGFIAAIDEAGLTKPQLFDLGPAPVSMEHGARIATKLLELEKRPDAIMCVSDLVAFGLLSKFQRENISVPDNVLLAGFGAYDISAISSPTMTTIDVSALEIGIKSAQLIVEIIRNNNASNIGLINKVTPILQQRESTRC